MIGGPLTEHEMETIRQNNPDDGPTLREWLAPLKNWWLSLRWRLWRR